MIKTGIEFANACQKAVSLPTLYVLGAFGWPMTDTNKNRAINTYGFNRNTARMEKIKASTKNTFGFDCICFIKAILWGFSGDTGKEYGGGVYQSNGVPDIGEKAMLGRCKEVSADFSKLCVGEFLWTEGHCGVYVGNGLAVECTYKWKDGVQYTAVANMGTKSGYNCRKWEKHGKLPWLTYEPEQQSKQETDNSKADYTLDMAYLHKGNKGDTVKSLQILLIGRGYSCGSLGADGDFGTATDTAVRTFQKAKGLKVDGVVGKDTMSKLLGVTV